MSDVTGPATPGGRDGAASVELSAGTWWGPQRLGDQRTRFRLWAPDAPNVTLEIEHAPPMAMARDADGWHAVEAPVGAGCHYRFRLPDGLAVPDPASRAQPGGVHGWSMVCDSDDHVWRTGGWRGRPWHESIIQELHVGVLGGFKGVAERLPELAELGITSIELMPVAAFAGRHNWGYDGVLPYALAPSYGSPAELKALVDRAHELGLSILLDVVYNHFGPDGNYLGAYAPGFFRTDAQTPWGGAVAVDRPEVFRFFLENAMMWLEEYRFDGLRFDAVHAIENDAFLDRLAREIRARLQPDRHVHLVLENERNDADRLADGLYDAQWNDDFHNAVHVLLTEETSGYYASFAESPAKHLARCLGEGFAYQGETPPGDDAEARGTPSAHLPPTAFVAFLQNHDQVGNRAFGERLIRLTDRARLRAATALLLLAPQIPLLFMGEESGSESPFLFFTDFADELAEAVREGRRNEFAGFPEFGSAEARKRIPDPNASVTFERSYPKPGSDAEMWRDLYRQLLALRHQEIVPRLAGTRTLGARQLSGSAVHARWRLGDGSTLHIAVDLGSEAVGLPAGDDPIYSEPDRFCAWIER
ncbi:malto-oligosyltrehalose trehalohydrolase [Sphingosinicella sp. CPCC 101087]|uniref:malto-oligosyltrehalose trehalohydrolase n=1 Tax=Sphingosinicella sp. CPCC 101087 TaxID=2497754 RepID=UPI00101DF9C9|nr:malto-oligosyltrehalose trehalohydrolase [Sphingosinicella sp. CPCC 101087]